MTEAAARQAAAAWFSEGVTVAPLGAGHINDTWLIEAAGGRFVLQRLSAAVFPDPVGVAGKVARVVAHLCGNRRVAVPRLLATADGARWHEDPCGAVWRLWEFVAGARTLQALASTAQGEAAGNAFGRFQLAVADLPGQVADPIPHFMQLSHYLARLDAVLAAHPPDAEVAPALAVVHPRADLAAAFRRRDRLIHGDCKIDNLLFRAGVDEVACIIDLDTVMTGNWAWDFGDLVRSAAADGTRVSLERFASITRGFVTSGAPGTGGPERVDELVLAPRYVALMLGVRFLTDHLEGDRYFKVGFRGENLVRARGQLALLEDMERRERLMRAAAAKI